MSGGRVGARRAAGGVARTALAVLFTGAVTSLPSAALAQGSAAGSIRLVGQTAWVSQGGEFALRLNASTRTPEDLEVAVTIYPAVGSRSAFNETLTNRVRGSAVAVKADALSDLPVDAEGAITIRLPIQDAAQPRDPLRVRLRGPGVYPVSVELRGVGGGRQADRFVTHLVNIPEPVTGPKLAAAMILPLAAPPALQRDGSRRLTNAWSSALRALVAGLGSYQDVPVTVLPQPETLQALALSPRSEDRDAIAALTGAIGGRLTLASPYVRLNEPAYANGLEGEETAQRRRGRDVAAAVLGAPPDGGTAVIDDSLDDATANRLMDAGAARVVVRDRALAPINLRTTLTQPFQLRGRANRRLPAVAADDGLAAHFTRKVAAPLAAHQLLADLAVLYFDSPGLVRGAAALPPAAWRPTSDFMVALLDGLRSSPILLPVDAAALFAAVPAAGGPTRGAVLQRDAASAAVTALPAIDMRRARRQLTALEGLTIGPNPAVTTLEERLLVSQSADLRARQRSEYLAAARAASTAQLRAIRVPENQAITLTARRGEIPVTILRDVPYPVRVLVQLSSDKLQFPAGALARLDLTRRNTTTRFTVQARTSGTFPLEVTLRSPDGKVVLSRGRFTIRSRAASGVGVVLSVSAMCFLVLWWSRHFVRARRARRAATV
ncbi:MAG: hypothetical protein H0W70_09300 [Actinobacteria bacterium]|nr:hypothetical protein [Actinomycetota bacterium]